MTQTKNAEISDTENQEALLRAFKPRGGALAYIRCRDPEVVLAGASGTGKSYSALQKLYLCAQKYPGMRGAIVRKFRTAITQSAMTTFKEKVCVPGDKVKFNTVTQQYNFPNGSAIVVAGLDDNTKILSTEFDIIYAQECTEIEESDWEILKTRLRWNRMPYQQLIGDCNPGSERHWIKRREALGKLTLISSFHKDNPIWWNEETQTWTKEGELYIGELAKMSGHMRQRYYEGKWVGAEGLIYTDFDPKIHVKDTFVIPKEWNRYISIDFGFTAPFVCQWWAEDSDGRLYLYRELYGTELAVEDWAHKIHDLKGKETYKAIICDHDMEDRVTLERHMTHAEEDCHRGRQKNFKNVPSERQPTIAADKGNESLNPGIQQVQSRMKRAGDGKPRIFFVKDSIVERDFKLEIKKKPTCTLEEIDNYVWEEIKGGRLGDRTLERPRKLDDHGMDAMRYMVRHVDRTASNINLDIFGKNVRERVTGPTGDDYFKIKTKSFWK